MVQRFNYTSIKTVISKFYRDLKDNSISEIDIIEWIGEAMGFMKMPEIQEEAVAFMEVKNYQTLLPEGLQAIIGIAKNTKFTSLEDCKCKVAETCENRVVTDNICDKKTIIYTPPPPDPPQYDYDQVVNFSNPNVTLVVATSPNQIAFANGGGTITGAASAGGRLTVGVCQTETYTIDFSNSGMIQLSGLPMAFMNCLVANSYLPNLNTGSQNNNIPANEVIFESKTPLPWDPEPEISYEYRPIKRIRTYCGESLTSTRYEDTCGNTYELEGEISNCPENICTPCNTCDSSDIIVYDDNGNKVLHTSLGAYFRIINPYRLFIKNDWYNKSYVPVRLSNNIFLNSIVCQDKSLIYEETNKHINAFDEYTPVGNYPHMELRFSFENGQIAIGYLKSKTDDEGYPLIPDDSACLSAITYYIKWKVSERLKWQGRDGFDREAKDAEQHWLKYVRQFIAKSKMPFGVDQHYNLMMNQHYLVPNFQKSLGYFGQYYK